jgi:hypothetical protein
MNFSFDRRTLRKKKRSFVWLGKIRLHYISLGGVRLG